MNKIILIWILIMNVSRLSGQADSLRPNKRSSNIEFLSKGMSIGYRTGLDSKNNELLLGYYFNLENDKRGQLWTFDNDLWTNFKRIGFNSTISFGSDLVSASYSNDFFFQNEKIQFVPGFGLNIGYVDLISLGVYYHYISNPDIQYPEFQFRLLIRPSMLNELAKNG